MEGRKWCHHRNQVSISNCLPMPCTMCLFIGESLPSSLKKRVWYFKLNWFAFKFSMDHDSKMRQKRPQEANNPKKVDWAHCQSIEYHSLAHTLPQRCYTSTTCSTRKIYQISALLHCLCNIVDTSERVPHLQERGALGLKSHCPERHRQPAVPHELPTWCGGIVAAGKGPAKVRCLTEEVCTWARKHNALAAFSLWHTAA